jgi:glycosyltransferase involved in cell wall biosynthesis
MNSVYKMQKIALVLPARNEASNLCGVLRSIPPLVDRIIVVDNGSDDDTASVAADLGVEVVQERRKGYGSACLRAIAALEARPPDIIAFADADGSDDVSRLQELIHPIVMGETDFALEKRIPIEDDVFTMQQRFGNWLATVLIRLLWKHSFADLGPMRAIRWSHLKALKMEDQNFGWTIEMQIRAVKYGIRRQEYAIGYRKRAGGRSKVSGTVTGSLRAGVKILAVIARELILSRQSVHTTGEEVT